MRKRGPRRRADAPAGVPPARRVERFLAAWVASGTVSAAVGDIEQGGRSLGQAAAGLARSDPPQAATTATRFDLASLTKPWMATLALVLARQGRLPLDLAVGELWREAHPLLARRRLADLLRHRAGLAAWAPLALIAPAGREEACARIVRGEFLGARAGTYSDLGYLLWGFSVERATGEPLDALLAREVAAPLGAETLARSPFDGAPDVAECRLDGAKEVELAASQGHRLALAPPPAPGEVQDGNARHLGGLCGHAGLFGGTADLARLAAAWLGETPLLSPHEIDGALAGAGPYALGWARRRVRGSAGAALPRTAFGHTGFTGGSLWIEPERRRAYLLLAHRTSAASDLNRWRRRFHRSAAAV